MRKCSHLKTGPVLVFLFLFTLFGCKDQGTKAPDVTDIAIETEVVRFDSLLYSVQAPEDLNMLKEEYPVFYHLYFGRILGLKNIDSPDSLYTQVRDMLKAETFSSIRQKIDEQYRDLSDVEHNWTLAMKYYQHYFQPATVSDLYTTVTEFAFGTFIFPLDENKDAIGVSLDMFLGDSMNYTLMSKVDPTFSAYNVRTFNRDHLIKKAVDALLDDLIPEVRDPEFISQLLREGKKYYISDRLLPHISDSVIWQYTPDQLEWVKANEWNIYSFLVSNELFYSTQRSKYQKLLRPSPHTMDMPPEAPGQAVIYIGYRIVESFMAENPGVSLPELIALPANELFERSKYRPRR